VKCSALLFSAFMINAVILGLEFTFGIFQVCVNVCVCGVCVCVCGGARLCVVVCDSVCVYKSFLSTCRCMCVMLTCCIHTHTHTHYAHIHTYTHTHTYTNTHHTHTHTAHHTQTAYVRTLNVDQDDALWIGTTFASMFCIGGVIAGHCTDYLTRRHKHGHIICPRIGAVLFGVGYSLPGVLNVCVCNVCVCVCVCAYVCVCGVWWCLRVCVCVSVFV